MNQTLADISDMDIVTGAVRAVEGMSIMSAGMSAGLGTVRSRSGYAGEMAAQEMNRAVIESQPKKLRWGSLAAPAIPCGGVYKFAHGGSSQSWIGNLCLSSLRRLNISVGAANELSQQFWFDRCYEKRDIAPSRFETGRGRIFFNRPARVADKDPYDAQFRVLLSDLDVPRAAPPIARVVIATSPTDVVEIWRRAEAEMIASPYQTFDWYSAWLSTAGARRREEPLIVVAYNGHDQLVAVIPLVRRRTWYGLTIGEFAGGRHSNANFGLFAPSISGGINTQTMRRILYEITDRVGRIDAFCFLNMPVSWNGQETWMSKLDTQSSPSTLRATEIVRSFEEWQVTRLSRSRRKKLRQKLRYLNRNGPCRLIEGVSPLEVKRILAAFYEHKSRRFNQMKLQDPFADAGIRDFLLEAASWRPSKQLCPAIKLFALEVNGDIVSTLGAAMTRRTCSAMFLSFNDEASARVASPGDVLVAQVIDWLCEREFSHFDLGIGDAPYKDRYCGQVVPLRDFFFGTTVSGILIALILRVSMSAKRLLKRTRYARTMSVAMNRLRRLVAFR